MTPKKYVKLRHRLEADIRRIEANVNAAYLEAKECPLPKKLRPATAEDIIPHNVIWYKHGDEGYFWKIVEEVLRPNDAFKAYHAEDGCRYGLDDAWIEDSLWP